MRKTVILAALLAATASTASARCIGPVIMGECYGAELDTPNSYGSERARPHGGDNAYGLGVGMDEFGGAYRHDPLRQVERNAYGLGMGMDQYGRPVQHDPLWMGN